MGRVVKTLRRSTLQPVFAKLIPKTFVNEMFQENASKIVFHEIFGVATPEEPRGEKKNFFFVQILGCEKLLKLVEKCR